MFSDARVLRVGSTFMTVYINKFARRIYFGEVEGLTVEWIRTTGTLVLDTLKTKPLKRSDLSEKCRVIEDVVLMMSHCQIVTPEDKNECISTAPSSCNRESNATATAPLRVPLVIRVLSTIPVAVHAVGGHDGRARIVARLYMH
ncbi:RNB [Musa troglodytarum]|uniref:RNB n=1 Tax=Musa troglodytarum TaxID=320322 RepID=A0A9E7FVZ8_9LILI|nr:RNB [Musa troglodytarum]